MTILSTKGLSIGYTLPKGVRKTVMKGIDLECKAGELTCLLGLNGTGKSTLLRTLCGILPPLSGTVLAEGRPIGSYSKAELSKMIGIVLTDRIFTGGITIRELVSMGRYPFTDFFGRLKSRDEDVVTAAMQAVGITGKENEYVSRVSDGERQKAFIAKALAQECRIIALDEPTAFLDITSRIEVTDLLIDLAHAQGKAVLMSTHDLESAVRNADTLWVQDPANGCIKCGTPSQLTSEGVFSRIFGPKVGLMVERALEGGKHAL